MDGIFIQTDTSFNAKGDLTYETADGQENLSLTGNYKLNNVGDMKNHTFSVQLEVYYHTYLCIMIFLRKKNPSSIPFSHFSRLIIPMSTLLLAVLLLPAQIMWRPKSNH